ncbi:ATP-binding protein [Streptomyces sp. NPDC004296]|uniref:ATP-binding protein n=1 Tax=Streptomyces sp. NPDC004296 TaxID=3364697 RepID=UPI0036885EF3
MSTQRKISHGQRITSGDVEAPPPSGPEFHCPVPHAAQDVGSVRRRARIALGGWDLSPDTVDDALLVVSELVTNAVTHALPPAALRLAYANRRRGLRIEVSDGGPAPHPHPGPPVDGLPEEHGRGTGIVAALSVRHGVIAHPGGITRWVGMSPP